MLTRLGYTKNERMREAIDVLVGKQDERGRWPLEVTPYGRMQANFGRNGAPNKWVTLQAISVLKRAHRRGHAL
ncbi:MAG: hypothetical protein ACE5QF_05695 [Thermoplasmata archaeon]